MSCFTVIGGLDFTCGSFWRKYYQKAVIVNKDDLLNYNVQIVSANTNNLLPNCQHRIKFQLKEGKSGISIKATDRASTILGSFSKRSSDAYDEFLHNVQIPMFGVTEQIKCKLKELTRGDYFVALQYHDGTVEVYGFNYGLRLADYDYSPQVNFGGGLLNLQSREDALEDDAPLIYKSAIEGNETEDFDNNFEFNEDVILGDFNNDFNNDFYVNAI